MSRDIRKDFYNRDRDRDIRDRDRGRNWDRDRPYRPDSRSNQRKRSLSRNRDDKRRSRSPRKNDKDIIDDNILSEISKLPEPSELWDNQFSDNFAPPPPSFTQPQPTAPSFGGNYQASYSGIYDDFPSLPTVPPVAPLPDVSAWNQMSLPPPPAPQTYNIEDQIKKEAAIETEMRHQKAALSKQREDYIKKASILKKELDTLKDQRNELRGDTKRSPSPDTKRFLKENTKLQLEIQNKLKTMNNVVDMLNSIIGEEAQEVPEAENAERPKRKSRSPSKEKYNYVYYDPEMHWCRVCNEFPSTAKDYLNHLHSPAHQKSAAAHMEAPWHSMTGVNEGFPSVPSAQTKRTPIRGLQFFVPSTAWYCKLCDQFIGDLHCASAHLKSIVHSKNYINFVEQNPHWETDWMSDRQKAFEKSRASKKSAEKPAYMAHTITFNKDGFHTKNTGTPSPPPEKKKKRDKKKKSSRKRSSSSSSSASSSSGSVASKKKKHKSKRDCKTIDLTDDDKTLTDWMSSIKVDRLNDSDRKLLDSFRSKLKKEKYADREEDRRSMERSRERDRERERREIADLQRKLRTEEERRREERRSNTRDRERRSESKARANSPGVDAKKPEIKKMPFIGKMPVAEFKEKIAKAQLEKQQQQQVVLPPPGLALPTPANTFIQPTPLLPPPHTPAPPSAATVAPAPGQPTLPKDFQDALDIIFPSEVKNSELPNDGIFGIAPGFPIPGVMPTFPGLGLMQPQMFGFDLNAQLFQPRHQLYDTHVPLIPGQNKIRPQNKKIRSKNEQRKPNPKQQQNKPQAKKEEEKPKDSGNGSIAKNKEELDDLAMLGIDASDVGAGI
ncbi:hypothetical protein K1T71_004825 [Dendrolimus kikuchii]|uniref:Uncharacterized protein n=1 Tax=Dendrolimus kikuchii TaxID=765133 RepID=A0ACC1D695_9NEOP|nr:hypothetical protein K1T71_004825 [Dendrolimus kikuchii]